MKNYNINVNFSAGTIESDLIELVQNDYNSTILNFKFDTTNRVVIKMLYPDKTIAYVNTVEDNMVILEPGLLSQEGTYLVELSSYGDDNKLTAFATMSFYVRPELVSTDEIVEPDDRVPILDGLINEVDNINITASKQNTTTTVTIKKKDGTTEQVEILDGEPGPRGEPGQTGQPGPAGRDGTNGTDGFSPVANVSKSGNTTTITVTDKTGTTTAQVTDGQDAPTYTAGENITIENNVISALPGITFTVEDGKLVIDYE